MSARASAPLVITRRRFAGLSLTAGAALLVGTRASRTAAQAQITATMVSHGAGVGDPGYDALANAGGQKAHDELGVAWQVIEAPDAADLVSGFATGAGQGDLTIGVGAALADALAQAAAQFPERDFLLVDGAVEAPNVGSVLFKEQEAAFLAGVVAAWSTKNGRIGIVGGSQAAVEAAEVGFRAGVTTENAYHVVNAAYADTFEDPAKGKELAAALIADGADVIFVVAGESGVGAYQAALEHPGVWVIGSDIDREAAAPGVQLCYARKGIDTAVYSVLKELVGGQFAAGTQSLGLAEDGVSLETPGDRVQSPIFARAEIYKSRFLAGEFTIPATVDELAGWTPPVQPGVPPPCDCGG